MNDIGRNILEGIKEEGRARPLSRILQQYADVLPFDADFYEALDDLATNSGRRENKEANEAQARFLIECDRLRKQYGRGKPVTERIVEEARREFGYDFEFAYGLFRSRGSAKVSALVKVLRKNDRTELPGGN